MTRTQYFSLFHSISTLPIIGNNDDTRFALYYPDELSDLLRTSLNIQEYCLLVGHYDIKIKPVSGSLSNYRKTYLCSFLVVKSIPRNDNDALLLCQEQAEYKANQIWLYLANLSTNNQMSFAHGFKLDLEFGVNFETVFLDENIIGVEATFRFKENGVLRDNFNKLLFII